ncbi:hypothetical protein GALMADRAFT_1242279 [Galerina marginata CBS 339.88]|uniref:G domain-containing protein n=1 Tax=Galerina marginata (strain CBS 339.88) TaxID=685588 RepID=A0A067T8P4_GALM3|nr:hypothetical protein GALMADRAFT_1242279 [Galerina marginata CBS 339.88]
MSTKKTEILILVIGATGAGKSHFINTAHGAQKVEVGKGLSPCTVKVGVSYVVTPHKYPQYRIGLVDTPGFDATAKGNDFETLKGITAWLKESCKRGAKLGGVIYLHDMKSPRLNGAARRSLLLFRGRWKEDFPYVPVVLGTTKEADAGPASECLDELVNGSDYWKPLIDKGAQVFSFDNSYESAWTFIDAILSKNSKAEILILVMGATGVGKSYFINTLLKAKKMAVSGDLNSCTNNVDFGYVDALEGYPHYRIALVDTPGFNDTDIENYEILERITAWLKKSYQQGAKLGGVIYLHDITAPRFAGSARRNLQSFWAMWGQSVPIVLGTTKGELPVPGSKERLSDLVNNLKYWKPLIDKGAQVFSFDNSYESACRFINAILSGKNLDSLHQPIPQIHEDVQKNVVVPLPHKIAKAFRKLFRFV